MVCSAMNVPVVRSVTEVSGPLMRARTSALAAGRTVVAIAHRLETIRDADRILVLDEGRIVEDGDHETLLSAGGRYAAFWRAKERAGGWRMAAGADAGGAGTRSS